MTGRSISSEIYKLLGELAEGQKHACVQIARLERKVDVLTAEHAKTRDMVREHRIGWQLLVWVGGVFIAGVAAVKGYLWIEPPR